MSLGWFLFGWLLGNGGGSKEVINYTPEQYDEKMKRDKAVYVEYCISRGTQPFAGNCFTASPDWGSKKEDKGALKA
jgi:hypothetical protein